MSRNRVIALDPGQVFGVAWSLDGEVLPRQSFLWMLAHLTDLNRRLTEAVADVPGVRVLGPADPADRPTVLTLVVEGIDPHQLAHLLDDAAGIMVRSGKHCCHAWFHARGIPDSIRFSFSAYNTREEVEVAIRTLSDLLRHFRRSP